MRVQLAGAMVFLGAFVFAPAPASAQGPWHFSTDTLLYDDTDNVTIVTPQIGVSHDLDHDGGSVGVHGAVDIISAASVDVVSHATNRFSERRVEAALSASKAFGDHLPGLSYRFSTEPDYDSHGVGATLQSRLGTPDSVLSIGYRGTFDRVGMTGTPWSTFSESLMTHGLEAGLTQVLGESTVVRGVYTATLQSGYMEKPYRFVALFDRAGIDRARADGVRLDLETFDRYRLDSRPPEEVPDARVGHALALRGLQYIGTIGASIRLDCQVYLDSWGLLAQAFEPVFSLPLGDHFIVTAHARFYWQKGASFWERAYVVSQPDRVPRWRSADRDLAGYHTFSGGLRVEWRTDHFGAYAEGTAMLTEFRDFLFLDQRLALVGLAGVRVNP